MEQRLVRARIGPVPAVIVGEEAAAVRGAIETVLEMGARTADLAPRGSGAASALGTREMARAISDAIPVRVTV